MKKVIASDRKQFRKILSLYRKGDWDTALKEAWHMDTAARYYIPDVIWNEINQD